MRVSVLMAAYNAAPFIARAVASVEAQTVRDWELIVVDDGSTDATGEVVAALAARDRRIRLLTLPRNGGPSVARNAGIEAARGDWITVLDADDAWRLERLDALLRAAEETGAEFVADNLVYFDDDARREVGTAFSLPEPWRPITIEMLFASSTRGLAFRLALVKPLILRRAIVERGLSYAPALRFAEDLHLYAELLIGGVNAVLLADAYYIYTRPVAAHSRQASAARRSAPDVGSLVWIADSLLDKYASALSISDAAHIKAYRRRAVKRARLAEITRLRRARRYGDLAAYLVRHPVSATRYLMTSRMVRAISAPGRRHRHQTPARAAD